MYMGLLRESEEYRVKSTYFFIAINVILLLAIPVVPQIAAGGAARFAPIVFLIVGSFLSIYWVYEQRESHILHEVRFRTMMTLEREVYGKGALEEEWQRLGDYPFRRSPVFYVALSRMLPLVFLMAHTIMTVFTVFPFPFVD